jgi:hypothetical protein
MLDFRHDHGLGGWVATVFVGNDPLWWTGLSAQKPSRRKFSLPEPGNALIWCGQWVVWTQFCSHANVWIMA